MTIAGVVDLVHVLLERVEIVDYKTDRSKAAVDEYRNQVSVYYHVLKAPHPDREVGVSLFFTDDGDRDTVDPFSKSTLSGLIPPFIENLY